MIACLKTSRIERGAASWHTTKPGVNPLKVKKKHAVSPDLRVYGKFGNATKYRWHRKRLFVEISPRYYG